MDTQTVLDRACEHAALGSRGANPLVGAVLVEHSTGRNATGYHRGRGTAHAEVDAIRNAQAANLELAQCTLYVTLEPCAHHGVTPPCTQAILQAGIRHVVYAVPDPTPTASGGAHTLRTAGVDVTHVPHRPSQVLNDRWLVAQHDGRPFITAKIAQSLDGYVAAADGTSQWITGDAARAHAHTLRHTVDAIAVGTGTLLHDDPTLTARATSDGPQPLRVHIGLTPTPDTAKVRGDGNFLHLMTRNPTEVAHKLATRGIRHLLIEGGPTLIGAFLQANLVDVLQVYTAPLLLGAGTSSANLPQVTTLAHGLRLTPDPTTQPQWLGTDLLTHYIPSAHVQSTSHNTTAAHASGESHV